MKKSPRKSGVKSGTPGDKPQQGVPVTPVRKKRRTVANAVTAAVAAGAPAGGDGGGAEAGAPAGVVAVAGGDAGGAAVGASAASVEDAAAAGVAVGNGFALLGICDELLRALNDAGYASPTPIQRDAIPLALSGADLMGLAQTGTGKTAAFTIPIIQRLLGGPRRTRALILTPTRELCVQVEDSFRRYGRYAGLDVIPVYGGVGFDSQTSALQGGVDVVVATPGRLLDHIERGHASLDNLEVLVLDEADRMLDMGFAPQIQRVVAAVPPYRQTLLFSATMPDTVEALARKYLRRPVVVQVGRRTEAASAVSHAVYPVPQSRKVALLLELVRKGAMESVLVFTRTKAGADRVVRHLIDDGVNAAAMHANKSQAERERTLEGFRSGAVKVLVATDIAQRGLDISGITHVINYDVPQQPEDYVHRIGRTGRALATGDAYTFMAPDEIAMVRTIERVLGRPIPRISVPGFDFGTADSVTGTVAG